MRTFPTKQPKAKVSRLQLSSPPDSVGLAQTGLSRHLNSIPHFTARRRKLKRCSRRCRLILKMPALCRFCRDFSRIPIHPSSAVAIQRKLAINMPGDTYEQEADHLAEEVMRTPDSTAPACLSLRRRVPQMPIETAWPGTQELTDKPRAAKRHRTDCSTAHRPRRIVLIRSTSRSGDARLHGPTFRLRLFPGAGAF